MSLSFYVTVVLVGLMMSSAKSQFAVLSVAGDNEVEIYHNGRYKGGAVDWRHYVQLRLRFREGDVIALVVRDHGGGYGGIADFEYNGLHCGTQVSAGSWRAQKITGALPAFWLMKSFNSMARRWSKPLKANIAPPSAGTATGFPYWTGAKYVWAPNTGVKGKILLRLEVTKACDS